MQSAQETHISHAGDFDCVIHRGRNRTHMSTHTEAHDIPKMLHIDYLSGTKERIFFDATCKLSALSVSCTIQDTISKFCCYPKHTEKVSFGRPAETFLSIKHFISSILVIFLIR